MDHDADPPDGEDVPELPLLPGFREMALRRMSVQRRRLVAELTGQRRSAGLSQTEVAARMGTSQSAVARLETGEADVRVSTLERYAAAIGSQLAWQAQAGQAELDQPELGQPGPGQPGRIQPGPVQPGHLQPGPGQPGHLQPGPGRPGQVRPGPGQPGHLQPGPEQRGQL
jgi:DNA-binding XRE family transcriptional regulator